MRTFLRAGFVAFILLAWNHHAAPGTPQFFDQSKNSKMDLTNYEVSFDGTFDHEVITPDLGRGPWFAPIHSDFGKSKFVGPARSDVFRYKDNKLLIGLIYDGKQWLSGIIQSVDSRGVGFSQKYGYFEMKAKFPAGMGNWPAFWLKTINEYTDPHEQNLELDVVEAYGGDRHGFHSGVHLWPGKGGKTAHQVIIDCNRKLSQDLFDDQFHTYGVEVDDVVTRIYFDRTAVCEFATPPDLRKELFMLVDLAYSNDEPKSDTHPSVLEIEYVRAWRRR
jgi:hypothetical protein